MSQLLLSGFSSDVLGSFGGSVATGSFASFYSLEGRYFSLFTTSIDYQNYSNAIADIQSSINSIISPASVSITFDPDIMKYTLSASTGCYFSFDSACQKVLGFESTYASGTTTITSSFKPYFIWKSTNETRSNDSEIYELEQTYQERIADSGRTYSVGNDRTALLRDWSYVNEPKENLFYNKAETSGDFTYDLFLRWLRKGPYPFVVIDTDNFTNPMNYNRRDGTYEMVAEATAFQPKQLFVDYFDYWNIDLKTRLLSRPNQNTVDEIPTNANPIKAIPGLVLWIQAQAGAQIGLSGSSYMVHQLVEQSDYYMTASNASLANIEYIPAETGSWGSKAVYKLQGGALTSFLGSVWGQHSTSLPAASGLTIVALGSFYQSNTVSAFAPIVNFQDTTGLDLFGLGQASGSNGARKVAFYAQDNAAINDTSITSSALTLNDKFMAIAQIDFATPKTASLWINGDATNTGYTNRNAATLSFAGTFNFGLNSSTIAYYQPNIMSPDFLVYNRVLNTTELNTIMNYFSGSYGISYTPFT